MTKKYLSTQKHSLQYAYGIIDSTKLRCALWYTCYTLSYVLLLSESEVNANILDWIS